MHADCQKVDQIGLQAASQASMVLQGHILVAKPTSLGTRAPHSGSQCKNSPAIQKQIMARKQMRVKRGKRKR